MLSQQIIGSQAACLLDSCHAVATDALYAHATSSMSILNVMLHSFHRAIEPLRWMSVALLISSGLINAPLAKNDTLVRNGTVVSDVYFFGQSPPVYPSPLGNGTGDWAESYASAAALVAQLTMDEKISLTGGVLEGTGCDGNIAPISRVGFPGLCLKDSGNGVRQTDYVNGYPAAIHAGASWNRDLVYKRASHMGMEFRVKGINLLLGPTIGPLGRVVTGGRNWESFSSDPYLTGQFAHETVKGIQDVGVIASTKHFLANEQETNRQDSKTARRKPGIEGVSSNIDDKTLHELYVWPFQDALHAGSGSIMCSYNRLNNSYACQNSKLLNGILKDELGFQGYVVTDWEAQHSGVGSVLAGLDMTMPTPKEYWGYNLSVSIKNGSVSKSRLDDMATRILAPWYKMGQNSGYPARGLNKKVEAKNPASKPVLFDGAVEGHVLVKNVDGVLPLKSPRLLSLYGYDAKTPEVVKGDLPNWEIQSQIATSGTIIGGGGSASITPARISSPYAALEQRAYDDNTSLFWDFTNIGASSTVDDTTDACLVFINAWAQEGFDRFGTHDDFSDTLVNNIANQCANTIVVIHNAGTRLVDRFESNPNVKAIIFAHLPGQDSGRALVSLLYGDNNFSGKLPYTVAKEDSDYGDLLSPAQPEGLFSFYPQSNFTEGVYMDYRAFDKYNLTPRYEFGFGLSYTTFAYSGLRISDPARLGLKPYPTGRVLQGGQEDLWERIATVYADVQNTGDVEGKEVAQLYIGIPGGPVRQLRGFEKKNIMPGETVTVEFPLTRRDLSVWDVVAQKWKLQRADYMVYVGSSSRKLPLVGTLRI